MNVRDALITGVHTGLGNALAKALLSDGASVLGASRKRPEDIEDTPRFCFRKIDLAESEQVRDGLGPLLGSTRSLDLVILNAGVIGEIKDLGDTSLRELAAVMDVNVWANKLICDTLFDRGIKVRQIVGISSAAAFNGSGGWGAYSISKAALNLLLRVYAHEQPETHFTALAPGLVHSAMIDYICSLPEQETHPANARIRSAVGTDRMQSPAEAAQRVIQALPKLLEYPTGSYVDIREMASP
jgi:NAD(P)-dependent dehydrogenase (short-subunit alcohol dehydrogenase family)